MKYILISCLLITYSCTPGLERHVDMDEVSDTVKTYYTDSDGRKQGEYRLETTSGELIELSQYVDDLLHGERTVYRSDGTVEVRQQYDQGQLTGTVDTYYASGELMLRIPYVDGHIQGISYKYDEQGRLMEQVSFEDNEENGPFEEYHANGSVHWRGTYLNGPNEYGPLYEYDSTGVLIKEMICDSTAVCRTVLDK